MKKRANSKAGKEKPKLKKLSSPKGNAIRKKNVSKAAKKTKGVKSVKAVPKTVRSRKLPAVGSSKPRPKRTVAQSLKIVRIMGQGQYRVDGATLKKLNDIDNSIVRLVGNERSDDGEFRKKLGELTEIVMKYGKPLEPEEIIQSDIILPSPDMSIDEAKKLFQGEGVIPDI